MKFGTRAALEAARRRTVDVTLPLSVSTDGNGTLATEEVTFRLREMSGTERDKFEIGAFKDEVQIKLVGGKPTEVSNRRVDTLYLRARLVALCLVDDADKRMYADNEIHALSDALSSSTLNLLFEAAQKLNGLDQAAVEAAAKNSASVPADASPSALPLH
jgi:hypothetical protein